MKRKKPSLHERFRHIYEKRGMYEIEKVLSVTYLVGWAIDHIIRLIKAQT